MRARGLALGFVSLLASLNARAAPHPKDGFNEYDLEDALALCKSASCRQGTRTALAR